MGPLLFFLLVTALGLSWEGYDPIRDTQSELGGVDSPYGVHMNVAGFMGRRTQAKSHRERLPAI